MSLRVAAWLGAVTVGLNLGLVAAGQGPGGTPPAARALQTWAVVVGLETRDGLPAAADAGGPRKAVLAANGVRNWLVETAGWRRDHVLMLSDFGSRRPGTSRSPATNLLPTRENLDWAFGTWLNDRVGPDDLVVVYFAGPSASPTGPNGVDHQLLTHDPAPGWPLDRAIDSLVRKLEGKVRVVCWLETASEAPKTKAKPDAPAALAPGSDWLLRLTRWPGVTAWLSSERPAEPAAEDSNPQTQSPGLPPFTKALIEALGKPDRKPGLSACLATLQRDPELARRHFRAAGGVPPDLTVWPDRFEAAGRPARPEVVLQVGHASALTAVVTPPDDRMVLTAGRDATVRAWSADRQTLLRVLGGHAVNVSAMALTPDGRWLLSASPRRGVLVHDLAHDFAPRPVPRQPHSAGVERLQVLPDGTHAVSLDRDSHAFLWDLAAPTLRAIPWPASGKPCADLACGGAADGRVAARFADGSVALFDASGGAETPLDVGAPAAALAVAPDGRSAAVGLENGRVLVVELEKSARRQIFKVPAGPPRRLAFAGPDRLAVAHDGGLWVGPSAGDGPGTVLSDHPAADLAVSRDGSRLAACTENFGALGVWALDGGPPRRLVDDADARASVLAFRNDGRGLVWGSLDGSVRAWDEAGAKAEAEPAGRKPPRGVIVRQVSSAPKEGRLIAITDRKEALVWDVKGRTCRKLPGSWSAGAFLDGSTLALTASPDAPDGPGQVVAFDLDTLTTRPGFFARTAEGFSVPVDLAFEALAVSPDGRRVAAASAEAAGPPVVCVWDAKTGRLLFRAAKLETAVTTLAFSADGRHLAAAGDAPEAFVWDLDKPATAGEPAAPLVTADGPSSAHVTCVRFRPAARDAAANPPLEIACGHTDGRLVVWSFPADGGKPSRTVAVQDYFDRGVKSLWFSPDGATLCASGDGKTLWLGRLSPGKVERVRAFDALGPHHLEQINTLATLPGPGATLMVSGGDDAALRLWDVNMPALLGTFFAADPEPRAAAAPAPKPGEPARARELDWVVFAPDGHFDASANGREAVRFRDGNDARRPEQFDDALYTFRLGELLRTGRPPSQLSRLDAPPPLLIDLPPAHDPANRQARLVVRVGSPGFKDMRLYHNDVPVTVVDSGTAAAETVALDVTLTRGSNRFYVMASKDGAYDARSADVALDYLGPTDPARLHVVALGVGDYARRRLSFPGRDAERISQVLHDRALDPAAGPGLRLVLTDDKVTAASVTAAFDRVVREVKGRPQDTVVVFLAGHTGVFDGQRFCMLLTPFPFPENEPLLADAREAPSSEGNVGFDPKTALPFSLIALNLTRLDALKRLVIVDACQAEEILSDPKVEAIRKWSEIGTRRARTSYLIAARRGEPALEVEPLSHGLFTYALLRGMRAVEPGSEPTEVTRLNLRADADYDADGVLTTAELDSYVKSVLPRLASQFPALLTARRAATGGNAASPPPDQGLSLQGVAPAPSFGLVPLNAQPRVRTMSAGG